jgi:hypothetical protein
MTDCEHELRSCQSSGCRSAEAAYAISPAHWIALDMHDPSGGSQMMPGPQTVTIRLTGKASLGARGEDVALASPTAEATIGHLRGAEDLPASGGPARRGRIDSRGTSAGPPPAPRIRRSSRLGLLTLLYWNHGVFIRRVRPHHVWQRGIRVRHPGVTQRLRW